jgi:PAS domain S-box-containing protein
MPPPSSSPEPTAIERGAGEARQAFLLRLAEALRPLARPIEVQGTAARLLGEHLQVSRALYYTAEQEDGHYLHVVENDFYAEPGMPSLVGRVPQAAFGEALFADLNRGRTLVVPDVQQVARLTPAEIANYRAARVLAFVAVPLVKGGAYIAGIALLHDRPRNWTADEVALIDAAAERTWAAVEQARAEAALRESETTLRHNEVWIAAQKEAFQSAMNGAPLAASLGILVRTATEQAEIECRCAFYIADPDGKTLHHVVGMPESYAQCVDGFKISPESIACGLAVAQGTPVITPDVRTEPRWQPWTWLAEQYGYRGCGSFPVETATGRLVGSFAMYFPAPREPTPRDRELAAALTHAAGIIISRHQSETALRESESRLRAALEAGRMAHWTWDTATDTLRTSHTIPALFGLREGESLQNSSQSFAMLHPDEHARQRAIVAEATRHGTGWHREFRIIRPCDGRIAWLEERASAQPPDGRSGYRFTGLVWDITKRKEAEHALRQSEERYHSLFESIDEGFCLIEVLFDESDEAVDYRFLEMNPAFAAHSGLRDAEGKRMLELAPEHEKFWFETFGRIVRTGTAQRFEHRAQALNRWFDVYAFRFGETGERKVAVVFKDIADRKRAEKVLQESEERQAFLLKLTDTLRPLTSAGDIKEAAVRLLGERLKVNWAYYSESNPPATHMTVQRDYTSGGVPSLCGVHPFSSLELLQALQRGQTVAVADMLASPQVSAGTRTRFGAIGLRSFLGAPIRKRDGQYLGAVIVADQEVRPWRDAEITLVEDVADRTWAAVERAHTEAELRESERRLAVVFDALTVGVAVVDPDGHVVLSNREMQRFLPTNHIALHDEENAWRWIAHHPDGRRVAPRDFPTARALRGENVVPGLEMLFVRDDDVQLWTRIASVPLRDLEGRVSGAFSVVTDIDTLKRAEETMRDSEVRLRAIANIVPDLLWSSEPDGATFWYNDRWMEYTGQTFAKAMGWGWTEAVHPDDREGAARRYREAVAGGRSLQQEQRIRSATGEYRWFLFRAEPLLGPDGRLVRMYGAATDIEDMKSAEARLREADRRKNHFLATLGHELRNPLAAIHAGLRLLTSPKATADSKEHALPAIVEQTAHVERLVDDLLDVTRIVQGRVTLRKNPTTLQDALRPALEMCRPQAESGKFNIVVDVPAEPLPLVGDLVRLTQVFVNLIGNALKYSGKSRRIEVSAARREKEIVVRVRDYGQGITADLLPRVFDPFVQAKPGVTLEAGMGMGLAVVRELVRLHGGTVEASSGGTNQGSEFIVRLPAT